MARPRRFAPFWKSSSAWPDRGLLTQRVEEALFNTNAGAAEIKVYFANAQPHTAVGLAALASAYLADKNDAKARELVQRAWVDLDVPTSLEPAFLRRVGGLLTETDQQAPARSAALHASRWAGERTERGGNHPEGDRPAVGEEKKAEARLAVFLQAKNSNQLISKLPTQTQADWGLAVQKAQGEGAARKRRRKPGRSSCPIRGSPAQAPDGGGGRRTNAYAALRKGQPKMAYDARAPSLELSR